jgi:septal ring factor EnvC (AmiA/AmiB activator)
MIKRYWFWPLLLLSFFAAGPLSAQDSGLAQQKELELKQVRDRINSLKRSLDSRSAKRDSLEAELGKDEKRLANTRRKLAAIEADRNQSQSNKEAAEREMVQRQADLEKEAKLLATQVRAAYTSGHQERMKLLLNQKDPATLGRMMHYYQYFNRYRSENIDAVMANIEKLATLKRAAADEEARLVSLADEQRAEVGKLDKDLEHRRVLLASLRKKISTEGSEIKRLQQQEQDLARLVADLGDIMADYPVSSEDPISSHKGRLTWPVAGELLHDFGQPRASGGLTWNGVVLAAPRGREVRSLYHGRVVFADWLAGLGLLIIVDHGEGYMSLYGHNDTLLKNSGDWVAPGEVIATVGDSGGQLQTSLYFELRKGVSPINPRTWISRKPKGT